MRLLVTGGTGFLGKNVARALAARGHDLRVLARERSDLRGLPPATEVVRGDVTDPASLRAAIDGCDAVFHLAALVKMWVPERERFDEVNVSGLRNVLAAASSAGKRVVYTSSFIAIGPAGPDPADERRAHPGRSFRNDYERTKALADGIAREAARAGQDLVILYPGVVYGPGDMTDANLVVKMIADHLRGRFPGIVGPGDRLWCYAYVNDVAEGHVLALESARRGEGYFLGGENVSMNGLFAALQQVAGARPPRRHIPYAAAWALGASLYGWAELTGHPPLLTHQVVNVFREHWAYSSAKAEAELGYRPTAFKEGLRRTVEWLRGEGIA